MNKAHFIITHHKSDGRWCDSPVLKALEGYTIGVTCDDKEFVGVLEGIDEDGTMTIQDNYNVGWVLLRMEHVTEIHFF